MGKIKLNIIALASSESEANSFVVVLKEQGGSRRLPVVIGPFEAQAIALSLEQVHTNRPMTHDLMRNTLHALGIKLREVLISNLRFGVFHATLLCENIEGEVLAIDARTSDALALAVRFGSPIYVQDFIMDEAGIHIDQSGPAPSGEKPLQAYSDGELKDLLQQALDEENYEKAALIRDELHRRDSN
jgi:uncharacterized protein